MALRDDLFDYESWAHRLARETHQAATAVEALSLRDVQYEIAAMLADDIRHEARQLDTLPMGERSKKRMGLIRGNWRERFVLATHTRMNAG